MHAVLTLQMLGMEDTGTCTDSSVSCTSQASCASYTSCVSHYSQNPG